MKDSPKKKKPKPKAAAPASPPKSGGGIEEVRASDSPCCPPRARLSNRADMTDPLQICVGVLLAG